MVINKGTLLALVFQLYELSDAITPTSITLELPYFGRRMSFTEEIANAKHDSPENRDHDHDAKVVPGLAHR
jgi:chorismate mutase